jgi:hypothetical protein
VSASHDRSAKYSGLGCVLALPIHRPCDARNVRTDVHHAHETCTFSAFAPQTHTLFDGRGCLHSHRSVPNIFSSNKPLPVYVDPAAAVPKGPAFAWGLLAGTQSTTLHVGGSHGRLFSEHYL